MDIAGFAGFAERGPLPPAVTDENFDPSTVAIHLTGWDGYRATFGGFTEYGYLPYAVRAFFENGGTECYVARVAATTSADLTEQPRAAVFPVPMALAPPGITLAAAAAAGAVTVKITPAGGAVSPDLLAFTGQGLDEYVPVMLAEPDGTMHLGLPLETSYPAGAAVGKYQRAFLISAASAGNWGNRVYLQFTPLTYGLTVQQFALRVTVAPGADLTAPEEEEYYPQLSLDPASSVFAPTVVNAASQLISIDATGASPATTMLSGSGPMAAPQIYLSGGCDGLSAVTTRDYIGGAADYRGLTVFERVEEIGILCAPDAVWPGPPPAPPAAPPPPSDPCVRTAAGQPPPPLYDPDPTAIPPAMDSGAIYQAMIGQCGLMQYRTAILDLPGGTTPLNAAGWAGSRQLPPAYWRFAAVYYPWIEVADPLSPYQVTQPVPACGHVAGVYATTDHTAGVQKPPANVELSWAVDTALNIDDSMQGPLNQAAVNAIRVIPGRGIRVWGARSLATLDPNQQAWMYIHVRRLMSAIEATVERTSRWAVFQVNNATLQRTLTHSLNVLLESIRQSGGLAGTTAANSYFVKCDATNNPPAVVEVGQLVCQVGVAVAAAAEFLVFEFRQDVAGANVVEA
jgi:hypothetical protein